MRYCSTRDRGQTVNGCQAIIRGVSAEGGLFVPTAFPRLDPADFRRLAELSYVELAAEILSRYLPELSEVLPSACAQAYAPEKFGALQPVRLRSLGGRRTVLELWHGPTLAFKDMALQLMPHLLTRSLEAERDGRRALILTATSGDTGKAALEGFSDVPGVEVAVFYPARGVGEVPRLQMATHAARNTHVFAVDGNFDDTQTGVKRIFADPEIAALAAEGSAFLSSANSINIGRLLPQVVYYLYAYLELLRTGALAEGETFRIAVPTGNFGNILAAWYAARMGVPICRLLCASNQNHILTDFFATGRYDLHRDFHKTLSPSMDILISSNLERLLFELLGRDDAACADLMAQLADGRQYSLPEGARAAAGLFSGHWAGDAETTATIGRIFAQEGYCIDPHTAVAFSAADALPAQGGATLIASTASPFKFPAAVLGGLGLPASADEFDNIDRLSRKIEVPAPQSLAALRHAAIRFDQVYTQGQMRSAVADLLSHRAGRS